MKESNTIVSIICPILNEEKYIENCIQSIIAQDYPKAGVEVLFVDGMSTDNSRNLVKLYAQHYNYIKLLDNPFKVVPHALNIGIKASKGNIIIRIDGHCKYPENYVSILVKNLYELDADNVGAVWNTLPANNTSTCKAIAICSSHIFGVGNSKHKIGADKVIKVDTVPFGCYHREIFDKIGYFDEDLTRNQDDEFNARLINNGGKIYLIPWLVIAYTARDSFRKMSMMYYQYGLFKPLVTKKLGSPATLRQFFPAAFLIGLFFGAIMSCYFEIIFDIYLFIIALYLLVAFIIGFNKTIKLKDWKLLFTIPEAFFIIHLSYGLGYIIGLYKVFTKIKINVEVNR